MMQVSVLKFLTRVVRYEAFLLGFFITTQPELYLQEVLNSKEIIFSTQIISLDCIPGVSQDIRTVLQSGFSRIFNDPRFRVALQSVPRPWPSAESIEKLVRRSSGQFIYSATVMKFISDPNHNPAAQLGIVLGIWDSGSSAPLAELDLLYHEILSRVPDSARTMKVLGYIIIIMKCLEASSWFHLKLRPVIVEITKKINYNQNRLLLIVEQLLDIPQGEAFLSLNQLHSLIELNVGSGSFRRSFMLQFYHRSFQDFLLKKKRSRNFYMDRKILHCDVAQACLKLMSRKCYETEEQHAGWVYACFLWFYHYTKCYTMNQQLPKLEEFDFAFQRFFFEPPKQYLDSEMLHKALDTFGLLDDHLPVEVGRTFKYLAKEVSLTEDCLLYLSETVSFMRNPVKRLIGSLILKTNSKYMQKSILFPIWRQYCQAYNNDPLLKWLLVHSAIFPWTSTKQLFNLLLKDIGLIVGSMQRLVNFESWLFCKPGEALFFITNSQYSGPFHCTPDDFADAYASIISNQRLFSIGQNCQRCLCSDGHVPWGVRTCCNPCTFNKSRDCCSVMVQ
ncbi:hypothetical protein BDQ17DRAFT_1097952 [Cyathus striatus]|nr:hypothetical protein BDQ17DRAFT_1097952 [Cyathus striatus]